jgi:hypothetical protein
MVWVGFLATAQGPAHLTPLDSDSLVHVDILHDKPGDDRSKTVQYLVVICHVNDAGRERSRSMAHQAVEVQGPVAMENCYHSALWPLNKHFQRTFDEPMSRLHAVHAVAE